MLCSRLLTALCVLGFKPDMLLHAPRQQGGGGLSKQREAFLTRVISCAAGYQVRCEGPAGLFLHPFQPFLFQNSPGSFSHHFPIVFLHHTRSASGQERLASVSETSSGNLAGFRSRAGRKNKHRIDSSGLNHLPIQGKAFFFFFFFNKQNILHEAVGVLLLQMLSVNQNLLKLLQKHSTTSQNKHLCVSLPG